MSNLPECIHLFSEEGQEEIEILVHAAANLQTNSKEESDLPKAFASLKVIFAEEIDKKLNNFIKYYV